MVQWAIYKCKPHNLGARARIIRVGNAHAQTRKSGKTKNKLYVNKSSKREVKNMKKSFLSKVIVAVLVVLSIFAMTFVVSAEETTTNVAKIGDTEYATLKEAITAANAIEGGATITLLKDVTIGEKFTIEKDITISGACKITRADDYTGTFFVVNEKVTLTLDGDLVIDGGNEYAFDKDAYMADAESRNVIATEDAAKWFVPEEGAPVATAYMFTTTGGTINFNNVTVQNNYSVSSGIVSVGAKSTITFTGAKITHIAATQGSGVVVNASGANINIVVGGDTIIDGNHVGGNHGIFKVYSGAKLTMNGGTITNNTGWNSNGIVVGLYGSATIDGVVCGSAFILNDGTICSNVGARGPSNGRNAPIYGHTQHVFIMNGGTICHNSGGYAGLDAPYANGTTEINGGSIVNNVSFSNNAYPDINATDSLEITGGTFTQVIKPEWIASDSALVANSNGTYGVDKVEELEEFAQAKIGDTYYTTLKKAVEAAQDGATIKLLSDIAIDTGITNTKKVTLDLNGKTITGTDNATGSFAIITNKGELTITGNGTITLTATNNRGWNAYSSVISNTVGGKLIVTNGTIEHRGGTDMAYAIDNLTNGKGTYAETVINGGTIKSTYRAIRQFLNGVEAQNILTVNGGTIEGANKSIWMQDSNASANPGTLTVKDTAVINGDIFLSVTAGSTEWPVAVSIAASAVNGDVLTNGNEPEGYVLENKNGVWGTRKAVYVAQIGENTYETLADAIAAANAGDILTFLADITEDVTITKAVTIDGAGFTFTGKITVAGNAATQDLVTFKNVKFLADTTVGNNVIVDLQRYAEASFDGCDFTSNSTDTYYNSYKGITVANDCTVTIKNSTASKLYYMVHISQGSNSLVVENCTLTNMVYGIGAFKCENVTVKNVTYTGLASAINVKNSIASTLLLDNVTLTTTMEGQAPVAMWKPDSGNASVKYTIKFIGTNTVNGEELSLDNESNWFVRQDESNLYEIIDLNPKSVKIGETTYASLADALAAANAGDTIIFLADITENVTINKSITIDGDNFKYTGTMTVNVGLTVTIKEVNFVNGGIAKTTKSTTGIYTIQNCTFDGANEYAYAFHFKGANNVVIKE
jgi:hypothetical protein